MSAGLLTIGALIPYAKNSAGSSCPDRRITTAKRVSLRRESPNCEGATSALALTQGPFGNGELLAGAKQEGRSASQVFFGSFLALRAGRVNLPRVIASAGAGREVVRSSVVSQSVAGSRVVNPKEASDVL